VAEAAAAAVHAEPGCCLLCWTGVGVHRPCLPTWLPARLPAYPPSSAATNKEHVSSASPFPMRRLMVSPLLHCARGSTQHLLPKLFGERGTEDLRLRSALHDQLPSEQSFGAFQTAGVRLSQQDPSR